MAKISYTAATLAAQVEVNAKELRKYLRTPESGIEPVGKGGRYNIELTATGLAKFKKSFSAWRDAQDAARADRDAEKRAKELNVLTSTPEVTEVEVVEDDTEATPEELDFDSMTDEDIEAVLDEIATEGLETDEVEA